MLTPEWYFAPVGRSFIAFANSDVACSRYEFNENGIALRRSPRRSPGSFAEAYRSDLKNMQRIGTLSNHLNIQDAVKRGKLSDVVIAELRRNMPSK